MKVEVKETQSRKVDWSKNPQLVVSEQGYIVLVHENQNKAESPNCFVGTVMGEYCFSTYSESLSKAFYKPFHGEITLKND